jgi:RES domain-containing protein
MANVFHKRLADLPAPALQDLQLFRFVPKGDLEKFMPPNYLFTSGSPGRFNPAKTATFYTSENATVAGAELDRRLSQLPKDRIPPKQVLYSVQATLGVLDLGDASTLKLLGLTTADLAADWEFPVTPPLTQQLGLALSQQSRFGAIRAPSDAAAALSLKGFNFVMFPSAIIAPMSVVIRDDASTEIQRWPAP